METVREESKKEGKEGKKEHVFDYLLSDDELRRRERN